MIPSTVGFLNQAIEIKEQPSKTYKMNIADNTIRGYVDKLDAIRQTIFRILNTERYKYIIYSWDYGIETLDLYGKPVAYVCSELERRITEALIQDDRITSADSFGFDTSAKGIVSAMFTVHTILGDIESERSVKI